MPDGPGGSFSASDAAQPVAVRLRLSPMARGLVAWLVGRVRVAVEAALDDGPPGYAPGHERPDPDLAAAWIEGLRAADAHDAAKLLGLLEKSAFGRENVALAADEAEAVMRASVRVRLHLHETLLKELTADELGGFLTFGKLGPAMQQGYACYRLLLHLEEDLLAQLNPGLYVD